MTLTKRQTWAAGSVVLVLAIGALVWSFQSTLRGWFYSQAMPVDYFSHFAAIEPALYQVSGPVYAFETGFTRSLVLRTDQGIAVFDTFNEVHVAELKAAIALAFPGETVRWVILSHNHLDHIRASDQFAGAEIIGHEGINALVADWPMAGKGVAAVTHPISGDQVRMIGGIEVHALYMPLSHSQTLYGFHIPSASTVYAPDMMFVKTIPPFDFPDHYFPGYVRALDRLIALNAAHYVPSHAWRGTRDDLIAYRNMAVDFETIVSEEILAQGPETPTDGAALRRALRAAYARLQPSYGDWHGFEDMFIPKFGRHVGGTYLGY